ncbi:MAG: hypothetical protein M1511_12685 [Deltaproteobacteria bacterium]|nr:hypothetical protein [Deltaproteobacteria bacterium]
MKKLMKYFSKHVFYNGLVHVCIGVGLGILVTYPLIGDHPVRWGIAFLAVGVLGHVWAYTQK